MDNPKARHVKALANIIAEQVDKALSAHKKADDGTCWECQMQKRVWEAVQECIRAVKDDSSFVCDAGCLSALREAAKVYEVKI